MDGGLARAKTWMFFSGQHHAAGNRHVMDTDDQRPREVPFLLHTFLWARKEKYVQ